MHSFAVIALDRSILDVEIVNALHSFAVIAFDGSTVGTDMHSFAVIASLGVQTCTLLP